MSDTITKRLEQVKELMKAPIPEPEETEMAEDATPEKEATEKPAKKAVKKAVKKAAKKVVKKVAAKKPAAKAADDNSVSLADLADKAKITPQRARQKLRAAEIERDGRWSWEKGSRALAKVEKVLGL